MRIALCSDSHSGMYHIDLFKEFCESEKIDQVFHMGDMVEDAKLLADELDIPVAFVAGNCDYYSDCAREKKIELCAVRFLLTHGDKWGVKTQLNSLSYHAEEAGVQVACFGHTHRQFCGYLGNVLLINPGALKDGKAALIELKDHDIYPELMDLDLWKQGR